MLCCDSIGADTMPAPIGIIMGAAIMPIGAIMDMGFMPPPMPPPNMPIPTMPIGAIMVMGPAMLIGFIICDIPNWACALPLPIRRAARASLLICIGLGSIDCRIIRWLIGMGAGC